MPGCTVQPYLMVPAFVNVCLKVSPPFRPPALPDLKSGPGPSILVTSWPTVSSLVHVTVPPLGTLTSGGLKSMSFMTTSHVLPAGRGAAAAGAGVCGLLLARGHRRSRVGRAVVVVVPPQPAATRPRARQVQSIASHVFISSPPGPDGHLGTPGRADRVWTAAYCGDWNRRAPRNRRKRLRCNVLDRCIWARSHRQRRPGESAEQKLQQRLLGVQAVLGLVPHGRALAVQELRGDLLAGVGGQAVEDDRVLARPGEQRLVEAVGREQRAASRRPWPRRRPC